jgi:hypothetical protein
MSLPFPETGYITSIVPLDCWIQITTEVATKTKRHCAIILIGNTNYRLKPGDIVWWNENREIFWAPASETIQEAAQSRKQGHERRLWLTRIINQESHVL